MSEADLREENDALRRRLEESEQVIRAIRTGAVDAFVVAESDGAQVYTLQTADRPYRLLVERMQQGALTLGDGGAIAYCNRRFADLVGRPLERLTGVAFRDFIPPDARPYYENLFSQSRAGAGQGEVYLQKADGGLIPVFLTLNAFSPESGMAVGVLVTDLTTQRHHEKLNAALESLKDSDRLKNEFLAMLSHELRNPLAPIANAVQLLRLQPDERPVPRQARSIIERQLGQLTRLVDDLMEVSRITSGRVQLRLERVAFNKIAERAVESVCPLMGQHRHELEVELSPEPIWLDADASRLEQVVVNLLTNAAKYTPDGGRISLSVRQEGGECVVRVRDTGVGIAPELLPRVFDLFTQAERSLDRSQGGLGIGLALVQRLVEMHRGRAEATSVLGSGSEFTLRLPAVTNALPAPNPVPIPVGVSEANGPSLRILIVDDNQDAAESLDMLLQSRGHDVRTVYTGPAGLQAALEYLPEAVLLDIGLPEMDGLEVARRIRRNPGSTGVVLIAMTGYGQDDDRQHSRDAGFDHHLVKPADFDAVLAILESVSPTRKRGSQSTVG